MQYKDPQNKLHALDSTEYEHLLPAGSVRITDTEAAAIRLAAIPLPTPAELAAAAQRSKDESDATTAKAYTKLTALRNMTPAQVQTWVAANVTNLAQAQDAIATLAIAVSVLARRL